MVQIISYNCNVYNYRGFAVAAISESRLENRGNWLNGTNCCNKSDCIKQIPSSIAYDEYIAIVSIVNTSNHYNDVKSQIAAMF